jgi:hypothetical protein
MAAVPDQVVEIVYLDSEGTKQERSMQFKNQSGSTQIVFFSFVPSQVCRRFRPTVQWPDMIFWLSEFTMLRRKGRFGFSLISLNRKFDFECYNAEFVTILNKYIGQKLKFVKSSVDGATYEIQRMEGSTTSAGFFQTTLPNVSEKSKCLSVSRPGVLTNFWEEIERSPLPSSNPFSVPELTKNRTFSMFKESLVNFTVDDVLFDDIEHQCSSMMADQVSRNIDLQVLVKEIEKGIASSHLFFEKFNDPSTMKEHVFKLLVYISIYNWDGASYQDYVFSLLIPFLEAYIDENGEKDMRLPEIFEVFLRFYQNFGFSDARKLEKRDFIGPVFDKIAGLLESKFPQVLEMMAQKYLFSLEFLRQDCSVWFSNVFKGDGLKLLLISIVKFKDVEEFFESFLIAILINILQELCEVVIFNSDELVMEYEEMRKDFDARKLLNDMTKIKAWIEKQKSGTV